MARDLGIDPGLLNRWRREAAREGNGFTAFTGHGVPRDEEMSFELMDAHRTGWSMRIDMMPALPMLTRSMSRKGNCWDNACAESFFRTLKREVEELDGRTSRRKVKAAVFEYIEVYYNRKRLHSRNGYKPPAMVARSVA